MYLSPKETVTLSPDSMAQAVHSVNGDARAQRRPALTPFSSVVMSSACSMRPRTTSTVSPPPPEEDERRRRAEPPKLDGALPQTATRAGGTRNRSIERTVPCVPQVGGFGFLRKVQPRRHGRAPAGSTPKPSLYSAAVRAVLPAGVDRQLRSPFPIRRVRTACGPGERRQPSSAARCACVKRWSVEEHGVGAPARCDRRALRPRDFA